MTTEEKIFELLKYANNQAVEFSKTAKDLRERGYNANIASSISGAYSDLIKYYESLNKI